jgi:hypothetical protein
MPELYFKGKEFVYNHHLTVPYRPLKWLRGCADMGLPNYLLFGSDPHLRGLHNRPEFLALMSDLRRKHDINREEFGLAGGNHFT